MYWWPKANCPAEHIMNSGSKRWSQRTVLIFPAFKSSVGRSVMKLPSTTGTKTKVPKKPLALISKFAPWREFTSTARKQSSVSWADEQLKPALVYKKRIQNITQIHTPSGWQPHYTVTVVCFLVRIKLEGYQARCHKTYLWNAIVVMVLRWQESRAHHRSSEKWWWRFSIICYNLL